MSPNLPLVSFVVQCYNTEPFVRECISSILGQADINDWEIIAIDDCSSDNTFEILQSFKDSRLRVIRHEKNQGHGATIAEALHATRGKFVARIDSDDRYRPGFLSKVLPIFKKYAEVGLVYGDVALIDTYGNRTAERCDRQHGRRDFKGCELVELLRENFICAPTIIVRREHFLRHLPVPSHLAFHDWYFTVNIARQTEFYYLDDILCDYRVHQGNMHSRIVLDRTEEPSIFWVLETVYDSPELSPALQREKLSAKRLIYGTQYLTLADKYFGANMNSDARRCYWRAICRQPRFLLRPGITRRFVATVIGKSKYDGCKRLWYSLKLSNSDHTLHP